jgi:hypothetical protein
MHEGDTPSSPNIYGRDTKEQNQHCVKRNHNPKSKCKIECRETRTPDNCKG